VHRGRGAGRLRLCSARVSSASREQSTYAFHALCKAGLAHAEALAHSGQSGNFWLSQCRRHVDAPEVAIASHLGVLELQDTSQ